MKVFTDRASSTVNKKNGRTEAAVIWNLKGATNLRRDEEFAELWRPAGKPQMLADDRCLPLFSFDTPYSGSLLITLWATGSELSYTVTAGGQDIYSGCQRPLGTLPGRPLDFFLTGSDTVKILLEDADPCYLLYNENLIVTMAGEMPALPEIGIGVADVQMMRATVRGATLSGLTDGRTAGALATADNALLVARASEAYTALKASAQAQGRFLQPVLARWRVVDAAGNTLTRGPWVYPSAGLGPQCVGAVSLASGDMLATVNDGVLQAQTYRLQLFGTLPRVQGPWRTLAARLLVEVTNEIDPVEGAGAVSPGFVDIDPHGASAARIYLPGCSPETAAHPSLFRPKIVDALEHLTSKCRVVAAIDYPFAGDVTTGAITPHAASGVPAAAADTPLCRYSAALRAGAALFLANPRRSALPAVSGGCFAISADSYSPLVTAYDSTATGFSAGGEHFALTPLHTAGMAYYLTDTLAPLSAAPQVPAIAPGAPRYGTLHCFDTTTPTAMPAVSVTSDEEIIAMAQPPRPRASWDFARVKLLLFSRTAIRLATFAADGSLRACAPFYPRGVESAAAICSGLAPGGAPCLYAVAGGDLLRITASRIDTLLHHCGGQALGWSHRFREVWMLTDSGELYRINDRNEPIQVLADEFAGDGLPVFGTFGGEGLISSDNGLFTLEREERPEMIRCKMTLQGDAPGRPRRLELDLCGSDITGSAVLSGDNGSEIPEMLVAYGLRGPLNAPLATPLAIPFRRRLTLALDLRASPDTRLEVRIPKRGRV